MSAMRSASSTTTMPTLSSRTSRGSVMLCRSRTAVRSAGTPRSRKVVADNALLLGSGGSFGPLRWALCGPAGLLAAGDRRHMPDGMHSSYRTSGVGTISCGSMPGFFAKRRQRKTQRAYDAALASWQQEETELREMADAAANYQGETGIGSLPLHQGERVF